MYQIVKRIVHTITTVTWLIRLEDDASGGKPVEKEITFPSSHSLTEEDISEAIDIPDQISRNSQPILDYERRAKLRQSPKRDEGEKP